MSALILLSNLLTHSRLKSARFCRREHQFKYLLGYRPVGDREALDFGNLAHAALEAWWLGIRAGYSADACFAAAAAVIGASELDGYQKAKAEVMMMGYSLWWKDSGHEYEVLGVEERFEIPLRNPDTGGVSPVWRLGGKLDVRVRRLNDGAFGFIEHKTSSEDVSLGSAYWKRLRLDSQVSLYFDGAEALGERPTFCLYDVLAKPAQKPLKATPEDKRKYKAGGGLYANQRAEDETPDEYRARLLEAFADPSEYFTRGEVVRLEHELAEARADIWQQAAQLREEIRAERFPKNPDNCARCDFFSVCAGEASLDDTNKFTRTDTVHPELGPVPQPEQLERGEQQ